MEKPKRIGHKTGIFLIFMTLGYISVSESIKAESFEPIIFFFITILFVFFGYWRLYQFYKLEKLWNDHNRKDFNDYFDNMTRYQAAKHFVTPFPILKRLETKKENKIRNLINMSTIMIYLLAFTFIVLITEFEKFR